MVRFALVPLAVLALASGARAQSRTYMTRHWTEAPGDVTVTLNGQTFVNHGLVGQAADATAAQSEMIALSDTQFLVLSRDGNGRGKGNGNAAVFKSVLLVDTDGATNLAGTPYEQSAQPVAKNGALAAGIVPVRQAELVNMLNPVQLGRFGMNLDVQPSTPMTLPEKLEAMAIAPALDPKAPNDVFLLVGNDNDFETARGHLNGQDFDAGLSNAHGSGAGDNDNLILVYRLTLPMKPVGRKMRP